jgi:hypothetical protein
VVGAPWLLPGRSRAVLPAVPATVLMRDIAWGIGAGLFARLLVTALSVLLTGSTGLAAQPTLSGPPSVAVLVAMALAPVVLAPVIEELYFRGLIQGAVARLLFGLSDSRALASWTATLGTAGLFAVVHLVVAPGAVPVLTLLGTFLMGLGFRSRRSGCGARVSSSCRSRRAHGGACGVQPRSGGRDLASLNGAAATPCVQPRLPSIQGWLVHLRIDGRRTGGRHSFAVVMS